MNAPNAIVLHVCCAPCSGHCIQVLQQHGYDEIQLYFANANIFPEAEFHRRLAEVRRLAHHEHLPVRVAPYDHDGWQQLTEKLAAEPEGGERCRVCFAYNLALTAREAARQHLPFTTTLSVSPHKSSATLMSIGSAMQGFIPFDFKKRNGFAQSMAIARTHDFYRQTFCGCEFSRRDGGPVQPFNSA